MAEGTRMKSFEEQLRKQDARIQAVLDSMVADKQVMEERLETNQREMRTLMEANNTELKNFVSNQISSILRSLQGDRGILGILLVLQKELLIIEMLEFKVLDMENLAGPPEEKVNTGPWGSPG